LSAETAETLRRGEETIGMQNEMPTAELIGRLRKATGLGWLAARMFLAQSGVLAKRIIAAHASQKERTLHDPIEDDAVYGPKIAQAKAKAEQIYRDYRTERNGDYVRRGLNQMVSESSRGSCHFIWRETKRILAEQGVTWYSPAEMNPAVIFD
jgi:hypothetical protein